MFGDKKTWRGSRDGFGEALIELADADSRIVVLTCDLTESTRIAAFKARFPTRFYQFGVAEQNMMGIAAGMSLAGKLPFVCTYGVFATGRCWEQLRLSVCYSNCNVKVEGAHAGLLVGPDGASHQATEDIAVTRVLPNLKVVVPCDAEEARKATLAIGAVQGPCYIRLGREPIPVMTSRGTDFELGRALVMRDGKDAVIFACGVEVWKAYEAAETLQGERGLNVAVVNVHTIKPLDVETIVAFAQKTGNVVTAEEHQKYGGLGGAIAETLAQKYPVSMRIIGIDDVFGTSGQPLELLEHFGLGVSAIKEAVCSLLKL